LLHFIMDFIFAKVLYHEMTKTTKLYLHGCSQLDADWLAEVVPSYFQ